jgi:SAM-dependent methyltransferase
MSQNELFKVEGLPVFQNKMFADHAAALACPRGNIVLVQDMDSGLIFNNAFDASLLEYDTDYQNEQACSFVFQKHLESVTAIIEKHFSRKSIIEVGCGKGHFLEHLSQEGYDIQGIDPAYEGSNPKVTKASFEATLGLRADSIVLRHVLEHVSNPYAFLSAIADANGGKGKIYIEVPCFDWICERSAWFDIFYEHVNYFRLVDFYRMFGTVYESGNIFGGQYLYAVADLATLRKPVLSQADAFLFPANFLSDIKHLATLAKGKKNAVWGGASKGVIFTLYLQRAGINIDYVIDINPAKQGKYLAATGICVSSPEVALDKIEKGSDVFVMNSNYLEEIIKLSKNQFNYLKID